MKFKWWVQLWPIVVMLGSFAMLCVLDAVFAKDTQKERYEGKYFWTETICLDGYKFAVAFIDRNGISICQIWEQRGSNSWSDPAFTKMPPQPTRCN